MDRTYIEKHHIAERFVQGKLTGAELAQFEIAMLEDPGIVDDIEYAKGMQAALENCRDDLMPDPATSQTERGDERFWFGRQYAVAASVLLVVSTVLTVSLYLETVELEEAVDRFSTPHPVAQVFRLETMRSNQAWSIDLQGSNTLVLEVDVSALPDSELAVTLAGIGSEFEWAQSGLRARRDGYIILVLPVAPPGRYSLTIQSTTSDQHEIEYLFDVVR